MLMIVAVAINNSYFIVDVVLNCRLMMRRATVASKCAVFIR